MKYQHPTNIDLNKVLANCYLCALDARVVRSDNEHDHVNTSDSSNTGSNCSSINTGNDRKNTDFNRGFEAGNKLV